MKELIENIVKALVDEPEKVEVNEIKGHSISVIELRVSTGARPKLSERSSSGHPPRIENAPFWRYWNSPGFFPENKRQDQPDPAF